MVTADVIPPGLDTRTDVFNLVGLRSLHESRPRSWLVQIYPPEKVGRLLSLSEGCVTLGRDDDSSLAFEDAAVSRHHARVERVDDHFVVTDLSSRNGTYVNDHVATNKVLQNGDRIRIGHQILKFVAADQFEQQYYELIYKMMTTDGLTEAYNKRYLIDVLDRDLARARRTNQYVSVLMLDLDSFKSVNDTYGHPIGDNVLHEFCTRVRGVLRCDEVLARYGGEEFTVLLAHATEGVPVMVAERVRETVAKTPFCAGTTELKLTVSIGVATGRGELSSAQLLAAADRNLYLAKERGRNCVVA